jgi:hypothetical protein
MEIMSTGAAAAEVAAKTANDRTISSGKVRTGCMFLVEIQDLSLKLNLR